MKIPNVDHFIPRGCLYGQLHPLVGSVDLIGVMDRLPDRKASLLDHSISVT